MIRQLVSARSRVYTNNSTIYNKLENREPIHHGKGEYVPGDVHTNGIESFWTLIKSSYNNLHQWIRPERLHRYATKIAGRYNMRPIAALAHISHVFGGLRGKRLTKNGLQENRNRALNLDSAVDRLPTLATR